MRCIDCQTFDAAEAAGTTEALNRELRRQVDELSGRLVGVTANAARIAELEEQLAAVNHRLTIANARTPQQGDNT